jgi:aminoglycoside phosphotransferase (APT) family kinase protein
MENNMTQRDQRPEWQDLAAPVRAAIELLLGAPVTAATTPPGGNSPHLAARLALADGRRVFVKSSPLTAPLTASNRYEAAITQALPGSAPAPTVLAAAETAGWFTVVYTDVPGRHPDISPGSTHLRPVLDALARVARLPVGDGLTRELRGTAAIELAGYLHGWALQDDTSQDLDPWAAQHLGDLVSLESERARALDGDALGHSDARPDNMLLHDGQVILVDWSHALVGAAWLDAAYLAPQMILDGWQPVDALDALLAHPLLAAADRRDATIFWVALTGYWQRAGREQDPPGAPGLRPYQRAAAAAGLSLLKLLIP